MVVPVGADALAAGATGARTAAVVGCGGAAGGGACGVILAATPWWEAQLPGPFGARTKLPSPHWATALAGAAFTAGAGFGFMESATGLTGGFTVVAAGVTAVEALVARTWATGGGGGGALYGCFTGGSAGGVGRGGGAGACAETLAAPTSMAAATLNAPARIVVMESP